MNPISSKLKTSKKKKAKKPFFKKWWFWLLTIIIIAGIFGESEDTSTITSPVDDIVISDASSTENISSAAPPSISSDEQSEEKQTQEEEPQKENTPSPETQQPLAGNNNPIPEESSFEVHFIDVGQADAALVLCDGYAMLIDGGNSKDSSLIYSYLKKNDIHHLDYIVATHGHEDHVGGLSGALNYATVDTALCSVTSYDSEAFNDFIKYLDKQNVSISVPAAGDSFNLGNASIQILAPINHSDDPNNMSIVLRIVYGDTSFLFTGDAERDEEQDILNTEYSLGSTVLKVGHHGSNSSTTYPFLREIMPEYAVISVGSGNSYGHPTEDTLSRLRDADVKVYRTDMQGTIICTSDGMSVSFATEKNKNADTLNIQKPLETSPSVPEYNQEATPEEPTHDSDSISSTDSSGSYIGNINSNIFHSPSCHTLPKEKNRVYFKTRQEAVDAGYKSCGNCKP